MHTYMLDTNVISHVMQGRDLSLLAKLSQLPIGPVVMSSVTLAELEYGLHRRNQPARLREALRQVLLRVDVLSWDEAVAVRYGQLCSDLESRGINLSDFDMMIAAHAITAGVVLVSRDKAFGQLAGELRLEVW